MATLQLDAQPRTLTGRKVKQLRREGLVPVVVYGNIDNPENLQINARNFERTLQAGGGSQLVQVNVKGGGRHNILVRDIQRHPVKHNVLHADFYAINMREKQQVTVPIVSIHEPEAMAAGLMVLQALDVMEVEALPTDIPATIEVDITSLDLDKAITVGDLPTIEGVEFLTDPEEAIFTMLATRGGEEEEEEEDLEEPVDGEPEVMSKGKQDEDEE